MRVAHEHGGALGRFFGYYGAKHGAVAKGLYPKPRFDTIIEPFAGSAAYATRYPDRKIILCDRDPMVVGVWQYLIRTSAEEIRALPLLDKKQKISDLKLPQESKWFIGYWVNVGASSPRQTLSKRAQLSFGAAWGRSVRERVAQQVDRIRHWQVFLGAYEDCPLLQRAEPATWFVDPPYQEFGKHYKHGSDSVDFERLGAWCRSRPGQTIVCENSGAKWLPFRYLANTRSALNNRTSSEVVWISDEQEKSMARQKPQPALNPTIVWMTLAKLRTLENPSNSKKHDIPGIVTSIREFGFVAPPILDVRTGMISAGHGRAEALEKMRAAGEPPPRPVRVAGNEWELPVVTGTFFSKDDQHAGAYLVADNQLTIAGGFDDELTAKLLKDLPLDLRVTTGFTEAEVDRMLKALNIDNDSSNDKLDEAPEPPKNPVSKRGDVWKLGQHLLYCGSCTKLATVFGKKQWRLMVTDPPFGVDYEQVTATKKNQRKVPLAIEGDVGTPKQMDERWREWFGAMQKLAMPGACFYICSPPGHLCRWLMNAIEAVKLPYRHQLVWAKQQLVLGRGDYHYQHEPILYGWVEGAAHYAVKDRTETTVWKIDRPRSSELHPTMKPVELYLRAFRNSSDSGDLCCEPFAGSGTAFVAGEKAGRIIYGAEIDLRYCDVVVERWQQVADKKATRRAT